MAYEFIFPDVGEGITEGEIVKWRVKEGDNVKEHDVIAEIETDKAVVQIPSPKSGRIGKLHHKEGDTIAVGESLATILEENEELIASTEKSIAMPKQQKGVAVVGELEEAVEVEPREQKQPEKDVSAPEILPAVRRLARELGVDPAAVSGTGRNGRITEEDIRKAAASKGKDVGLEEEQAAVKIERKYDMYGYIEHVPLKGVRKATARSMVKSQRTAPHVTHMDEADVTELDAIREKERPVAEKRGIKLTYLPFVIKAVVAALKAHPYMNAALDDEHEEIILKKYYNIGVAVDTPDGLIVPVLKEASEKTILGMAKEMQDLAQAARDRKLDLADLKGGTFTITNVGALGGLFATPIINWPEAAILATGKVHEKPVARDKKIVVRKIMPLSMSFDHRVADGAEAARFVNTIKEYLEDPELLLVESR